MAFGMSLCEASGSGRDALVARLSLIVKHPYPCPCPARANQGRCCLRIILLDWHNGCILANVFTMERRAVIRSNPNRAKRRCHSWFRVRNNSSLGRLASEVEQETASMRLEAETGQFFSRRKRLCVKPCWVIIPERRTHAAASVCLEARKACSDPRMRRV